MSTIRQFDNIRQAHVRRSSQAKLMAGGSLLRCFGKMIEGQNDWVFGVIASQVWAKKWWAKILCALGHCIADERQKDLGQKDGVRFVSLLRVIASPFLCCVFMLLMRK